MGQPVTDGQVAEHLPYIEEQAGRFARLQVPLCEYDDLVQVGSIKVFELLRDGKTITHLAITNAMRDELRANHRHGRLGFSNAPAWEEIEPYPEVSDIDELSPEDVVVGSF